MRGTDSFNIIQSVIVKLIGHLHRGRVAADAGSVADFGIELIHIAEDESTLACELPCCL